MRVLCPHCHAEESQCPETLPACRARKAAARLLYARANGSDMETLRVENEALRAEVARLSSTPKRRRGSRLAPLTAEEMREPVDPDALAEARRILAKHVRGEGAR